MSTRSRNRPDRRGGDGGADLIPDILMPQTLQCFLDHLGPLCVSEYHRSRFGVMLVPEHGLDSEMDGFYPSCLSDEERAIVDGMVRARGLLLLDTVADSRWGEAVTVWLVLASATDWFIFEKCEGVCSVLARLTGPNPRRLLAPLLAGYLAADPKADTRGGVAPPMELVNHRPDLISQRAITRALRRNVLSTYEY